MLDTISLSQFPRHVRERHETLTRFVQAYYAWMDSQKIDPLQIRDIDNTLDAFVNSILGEIAIEFPNEVAVDKRLFAKVVHSFYTAKGSAESVRLLFRILFDLDADMSYPSRRLLRPSDGKWIEKQQILARHLGGPTEDLQDILLYKDTLNYVSVRQPVNVISNGDNYWLFDYVPEASAGVLAVGDVLSSATGSLVETEFEVLRQFDSFNIVERGANYSIGDTVNVTDGAVVATGKVTKVQAGNFLGLKSFVYDEATDSVTVTYDKGHGLVAGHPVRLDFLQGSGLPSGVFTVTEVVSPFQLRFFMGVILDFPITGFVGLTDMANAGGILTIDWIRRATEPVGESVTATVTSVMGTGAEVTVSTGPLSLTSRGYEDVRGHLSENYIVIQDGKIFQAYSYIIRVAESITFWRDIVKQLVHPAGMYLLGEIVEVQRIPVARTEVSKRVLITTKAKVTATVSQELRITRTTSLDLAFPTRSAVRLLRGAGSHLPSVKGRSTYDTDALYSGITNVNYVGTVNEGYWYDMLGAEFAPIYYDVRVLDTAYTGVILPKPPLTRFAEIFEPEVLPPWCDGYILQVQPYRFGEYVLQSSVASLHLTERHLVTLLYNEQAVESTDSDAALATAQGNVTHRAKTYNTFETLVKIYKPMVTLEDIMLDSSVGSTSLGETSLGDG